LSGVADAATSRAPISEQKEAEMAAVVVVPAASPRVGAQLNIFPGSVTPTVFRAGAPFWIGSGFVPDTPDIRSLDRRTRFELDVDGRPVRVRTNVTRKGRRTVGRLTVASFERGLAAGWHRFAGRWYVADKLLLTNDTSIEFVEP
jgi:hypothetical protein